MAAAATDPAQASLAEALSSLRAILAADGYELELREHGDASLIAEIHAGPDACADCLAPKELMRVYFKQALRPAFPQGLPALKLVYPADRA